MEEEKTTEEQIKEAVKDVEVTMLENLLASKAEIDAVLRKKNARYALLKAQERLNSVYYSII